MNTAAVAGCVEVGSQEHRALLARFFLDSHVDYLPEAIRWPSLSDGSLRRLTGLPFWQEALSTENVTSNTVAAAVQLEGDPELRRAIELQGFEEARHARLLLSLTAHYRIPVDVPPAFTPQSLLNDFLSAGFGECFDSFFAFGLFALASESGFFAPELVSIFEPVIQEEARHILFFVNWVKQRRLQMPWWQRPQFQLRCGWIILQQVVSRIKTACNMAPADEAAENFTLSARADMGAGITLHRLLGVCISENERRLARYDVRLMRPRLVPQIARLLHWMLPSRL